MSHFRSLLWKNWIVWRRTPLVSSAELLAPVLLMGIIAILRHQIDSQFVPSTDLPEVYPLKDGNLGYMTVMHYPMIDQPHLVIEEDVRWMETNFAFAGVIPRTRLFFLPKACYWTGNWETQKQIVGLTPRNHFTMEIERQLNFWQNTWTLQKGYYLRIFVKYFDSTEEMFDYVKDPDYMVDSDDHRGLCFGISMTQSFEFGSKDYNFHFHFDDQPKSGFQNIPSQQNPSLDPFAEEADLDSYSFYTRQGFSLVQNWCANTVLQVETRNYKASIVSMVAPMISNPTTVDKFVKVNELVLPLFMVLMYLLPIYRYTSRLVIEKQSRTRELISLAGVSTAPYWLSWFVFYCLVATATSALCACILSTSVFAYSSFPAVFLFLLLYTVALFGYIMLVQCFFPRNVTQAAVISTLVFFTTSFLDLLVDDSQLPEPLLMVASTLPTVAVKRAVATITSLESQRRGFTLSSSFELVGNYRMGDCFLMLVFSFVAMAAAGLAIEQADFGIFKCRKVTKAERESLPVKPDDFEPVTDPRLLNYEQSGRTLVTKDLIKTYGSGDSLSFAVNGLNLELYPGQIFALLGHNGAGKTTTIKMLTGALSPSGGTMQFLGCDLVTERDIVQHKIGVCPQENVFYDLLTVEEHFELFESLKSASLGQADTYIKELGLEEYRKTLAKDLSGGNARKLMVGLALVGDSKLVLLDEPTAGLDLQARRSMWDILARFKQDRVMILTTHYMDEADFLGDRIGVMSEGRLICSGSSLFLKNRFQVGSKLVVQQLDGSRSVLLQFMADNAPDLSLIQESSNQRTTQKRNDFSTEACMNKHEPSEMAEFVFKFPDHFSSQYESFFPALDSNLKRLHIQSYSVTQTSLEDVFLQVTSQDHIKISL